MIFSHSFFDIISSFPSAIPSVLLLVVIIYWIMAVIGLVDIDIFNGHGPIGDVGHIGHGHGHVDIHHDGEHSAESGLLASAVLSLGLSGVPLSIVISVLILFTWSLTYLCQRYLLLALPDVLRWGFGVVALLGSFIVSLPVGVLLLRPLRGAFVVHNALSNEHLVGKACRILTLEVTGKFGQAQVRDNGSGYNIRVWALEPNHLTKGSDAVIISYDRSNQRFEVTELNSAELQNNPGITGDPL